MAPFNAKDLAPKRADVGEEALAPVRKVTPAARIKAVQAAPSAIYVKRYRTKNHG